jgi:hypothetical protein
MAAAAAAATATQQVAHQAAAAALAAHNAQMAPPAAGQEWPVAVQTARLAAVQPGDSLVLTVAARGTAQTDGAGVVTYPVAAWTTISLTVMQATGSGINRMVDAVVSGQSGLSAAKARLPMAGDPVAVCVGLALSGGVGTGTALLMGIAMPSDPLDGASLMHLANNEMKYLRWQLQMKEQFGVKDTADECRTTHDHAKHVAYAHLKVLVNVVQRMREAAADPGIMVLVNMDLAEIAKHRLFEEAGGYGDIRDALDKELAKNATLPAAYRTVMAEVKKAKKKK